jgi:hypothetical protein
VHLKLVPPQTSPTGGTGRVRAAPSVVDSQSLSWRQPPAQ